MSETHRWQGPVVAEFELPMVCVNCGISKYDHMIVKVPCPPWGPVAAAPLPGGLDKLGVVKELKRLEEKATWIWKATEHLDPHYEIVGEAACLLDSLQQLISRLDGQDIHPEHGGTYPPGDML